MKLKNRVVLSVGGSLIVPDDLQVDFLRQFREILLKFTNEYSFILFAGGGSIARRYQQGAKSVADLSSEQLDWIGIHASRLNAHTLRMLFGDKADEDIIEDPTKRIRIKNGIKVGGGWKPGRSTDYDAVMAAVKAGCMRVVNLTNIPYVYTKDPRKFKDAAPIVNMNWSDYRKLVGSAWTPGMSAPFDPIAAKLADEHSIEVIIADGVNIPNLEAILANKPYKGTTIRNAE